MNNDVANTIALQLGNVTLSMLGAKDLVAIDSALRFTIRGAAKVNRIEIKLEPSDTYTVRFLKHAPVRLDRKTGELKGGTDTVIAEVDDVYVDSLHNVIREHTGLETRLF